MTSSSPSGKCGRNSYRSSSPKKMVIVPLDTSDTINLNHLDVIPIQLVGSLDPAKHNVDVKIKSKVGAARTDNTNSDGFNSNCNLNDNDHDHDGDDDTDRPKGKGTPETKNSIISASSSYSKTIIHKPMSVQIQSSSSSNNKVTLNSFLQNQNQNFCKNNNGNNVNIVNNGRTNPFQINLLSPNKLHRKRNCNSEHNNNKYSYLPSRTNSMEAKVSSSFDRHGRMTSRIIANYTENREYYKQVHMSGRIKQLRKRKKVNLADILTDDSKLNGSFDQNQCQRQQRREQHQHKFLRAVSNNPSEDSLSDIPETVRQNIVKKIMEVGIGLQAEIKSTEALRKLQEALQDLQNDFHYDFTSTSGSFHTHNEYAHSSLSETYQQQLQPASKPLHDDDYDADENDPTMHQRNVTSKPSPIHQSREQDLLSNYKPPAAMNQFKKCKDVLTLCSNKSDLHTCHSSDCSIFQTPVVTPEVEASSELKCIPKTQQHQQQPATHSHSDKDHLNLAASKKQTEEWSARSQKRELVRQQNHKDNKQSDVKATLSPEKVAAIWRWVSPKYDPIGIGHLNLNLNDDFEVNLEPKPKSISRQNSNVNPNPNVSNTRSKANCKTSKGQVGSGTIKKVKRKKGHGQPQRTITTVKLKQLKGKKTRNTLKSPSSGAIASKSKEDPVPVPPPYPTNSDSRRNYRFSFSRRRSPSSRSLSFEIRDKNSNRDRDWHRTGNVNENNEELQLLDHENYDDNDHSVNRGLDACQLFLSDPITSNAFSRFSFQDGSFSDVDDTLPPRPFRGGQIHIETGHLDSYVGQVLSSLNFPSAHHHEQEQEHPEKKKKVNENKEFESKGEGPTVDDKYDDDAETAEVDVDLPELESRMTPPSTSTWNLSPLYEPGNGIKESTSSVSGIKFSPDVEVCNPDLDLDSNSYSSPKADLNANYMEKVEGKGGIKVEHDEHTENNENRTITPGQGTKRELSSECCTPSGSMTPFVFSTDLLATMADVHSGDDIATRCPTTSTVTDDEHANQNANNPIVRISRLSGIHNKLRLLDLLNEVSKTVGPKDVVNNEGSNSITQMQWMHVPSAPKPSAESVHLEKEICNHTNISSLLTRQLQLQSQTWPFWQPSHPPPVLTRTSGSRNEFPLQLQAQAESKSICFLPPPPVDEARPELKLTNVKSLDSMDVHPPTSTKVTTPLQFQPPTPNNTTTTTTKTHQRQNYELAQECIQFTTTAKASQQCDLTTTVPLKAPIQNSEHHLHLTEKTSSQSLRKSKKKKQRKHKDKDDEQEQDIAKGTQTDGAEIQNEKKRRKHRHRHRDANENGNDQQDSNTKLGDRPGPEFTKKRSKPKLSRKDVEKESVPAPIEKLKTILPRTPGGRYTLKCKEAEDAIVEYVKAELAASLGIGVHTNGHGQGHYNQHGITKPTTSGQFKPESLRELVRSVASTIAAVEDEENGSDNGSEKKSRSQHMKLKSDNQSMSISISNGTKEIPETRSKTKIPSGIPRASKLLAGSKSLKTLSSRNNHIHRPTSRNPSCNSQIRTSAIPRYAAINLYSKKRIGSIGVIPKQSTRPNFLRYQQQSVAAMLNISRTRRISYQSQMNVLGNKLMDSSSGSGSYCRSRGLIAGPGHNHNNSAGQNQIQNHSSRASHYSHNQLHQSSPPRSGFSHHQQRTKTNNPALDLSSFSLRPKNGSNTNNKKDIVNQSHTHSQNARKSNRNAVTVVFGSTCDTAIRK